MSSKKPDKTVELKEILNLSSEIATATGSAIDVLQGIKQDYESLSSTFGVRQQQVSDQINFPQKIDVVVKQLQHIDGRVRKIEEQTRPQTFWQKVKAEILGGFIGWIIAIILGVIIGWILLGHPIL